MSGRTQVLKEISNSITIGQLDWKDCPHNYLATEQSYYDTLYDRCAYALSVGSETYNPEYIFNNVLFFIFALPIALILIYWLTGVLGIRLVLGKYNEKSIGRTTKTIKIVNIISIFCLAYMCLLFYYVSGGLK